MLASESEVFLFGPGCIMPVIFCIVFCIIFALLESDGDAMMSWVSRGGVVLHDNTRSRSSLARRQPEGPGVTGIYEAYICNLITPPQGYITPYLSC